MPESDLASPSVDPGRVRELKNREDARFHAEHPRCAELLARGRAVMPNGVPMAWLVGSYHHIPPWVADAQGTRFTDVDGHSYSDFNIADMSMFCGYAPEPLLRAVADRMARGNQFLLPTEDAIDVSEELGRRYGLPKWQYTLSASQANTEAIRVARVVTGRNKILLFDGKYHGHFDQALVERGPDGSLVPEERGLPADVTRQTALVPFNAEAELARALEARDVALVLAEPAMTNNHGLILPQPGFHDALRKLTRETGTLLALDETHTQVVGAGGLTAAWGLTPDLVTLGKSIAGGVPFGAWGMTDAIAEVLNQEKGADGERLQLVATGGTLFGNALSMAAARATMFEILTPEAYANTQRLGECLATGMRAAVERVGLPWHIHHLGPRSGYTFRPEPVRDADEARACSDELLTRLIRIWLANRGVWEAIVGAGPVVSVPAADADVDAYLAGWTELLEALTR
ncbi:MAG: aminotransferase class III-fold pyridoxal phosphate-dependent enzyme [Deltaproteobacteria bacterium]|jgi:glutamate-1-semialdehyde 2,1-aminomutase|nr:aminotransferase class III-fold pyridoxal phosphate-dependent enzyme [Deltaproteobacteria bacterium]